MCGIFGSVAEGEGPSQVALERALGLLSHRGPDARGILRMDGAVLGHTRLVVIDPSEAAAQPMRSEDGLTALTYNGEIYNHKELRDQLEKRGHRFRSRSDTEVLLHGYREWGQDLPERLDGMFAFAIWDARARRLLLARDRAGEKPLFYHFHAGAARRALCFASEMKALAELGVALALDPSALPFLLSFGYVPAPSTLHAGVRQLPPASLLVFHAGERERAPEVRTYFRAPFLEGARATLSSAAREEVRARTIAAVASRLESDVPLGAFLSGGIDSSIVVGIMTRVLGHRIKTFSIGFTGDARYDETRYARAAARAFQTDHTELVISPESFDLPRLIERLVWLHDGPFGDSSAIPTYLVSGLARQHVTVALTGDGGDELFCGYSRMVAAEAAERVPPGLLYAGARLAGLLPRTSGGGAERAPLSRALRFLGAACLPLPDRVARWSSIFLEDLPVLLRRELAEALDLEGPWRFVREVMGGEGAREATPLARVLDQNFRCYLAYDLLPKVDRSAMGHGLETRAPFLARDLIECAARLPDGHRRRGLSLKRVLKEAFSDLLPPEILARGKMGFGVPLGTWFRKELRPYLLDHFGQDARLHAYLDERMTRRYLREHMDGEADHGHKLFTLLTLEVWLRGVSRQRAEVPCA